MIIEPVAFIVFDDHRLNVYNNVDEPLFLAVEVAQLIDYSVGNTAHMVKYFCEDDEKLVAQNVRGGQRRNDWFVTEMGLYNILSQSRKPIARKWRRVAHQELIELRRNRGRSIVEQFEVYNNAIDGIFYDEEYDCLMVAYTDYDGDVIIEPLDET